MRSERIISGNRIPKIIPFQSQFIGDKIYSEQGWAYLKQLGQELTEEDFTLLGAKHHLLHAFHLRIRDKDGREISAWDWDLGKDFSKNFDWEFFKGWCETDEFQSFSARARASQN